MADQPIHDQEPAPTDQPTEGQPAPEGEPQGQPEGEPDRRYAGKYTSVEELERGYSEAQKRLNQLQDEARRQREEQRLRELIQQQQTQAAPATPEDPYAEDRKYLREKEVDEGVIEAIIRLSERAGRSGVPAEVQRGLAPLVNGMASLRGMPYDQQMQVQRLLAEDPNFAQRFERVASVDPEGARYIAEGALQLHQAVAGARDADRDVKAQREANRKTAALPTEKSTREAPQTSQAQTQRRQEALDEALKSYMQTGDLQRFSREGLPPVRMWTDEGIKTV